MVNSKTRKIVVCGILTAISTILMMYIEFSVPFMPFFIKLDIADIPALLGTFALGPIWGVIICLIRNLINLITSYSLGVGELANFFISGSFVFIAGIIYKYNKSKKIAIIGCIAGSIVSALISFPINYYITYPVYSSIFFSVEEILKAYEAICGYELTLTECLIYFNVPFTFLKGLLSTVITVLIYKYLSPLLKGTN